MPGCGKSTVGAVLAQKLGKTFVDADAEIERRTGKAIPDIFAQEGEEAFRRYEADVIADLTRQNRQVIACGGGVVKTPQNLHALRQNGPVLWVQRPIEKLATAGRPLSKGSEALRRMAHERLPLYRAAATGAVCNDGSLADTVTAALHLLK